MIYDLDAGQPEPTARSGVLMTAVTLILVGVALVLVATVAFAPSQRYVQRPISKFPQEALPSLPRPTFVTRPVADRTLALPRTVGTPISRDTSSGYMGFMADDSLMTTYRLLGSDATLSVAWMYPLETLPFPSAADAPLLVRGRDASWTSATGGESTIRWLEAGMVYEMSSLTLGVVELAVLADALR